MNKIRMMFGPPGTGKTTRLLSIVEEELKKVRPDEIAFVSYTKKGSYEGKERAKRLFNYTDNDLPYFKTLHSLAFHELNLKRSDVIDKGHYKDFSKTMGMHFVGYYTEELKHNDDAYLFFNSLQRNNPKMATKFLNQLSMSKLSFVQSNYIRFKRQMKIVDYTDMIELFLQRNKAIPVKVAIVDEAQDLTTLQWKMVLSAFRDCERVYLAGDDDQAIYEWSGADVEFFLRFKGANLEILNKSYRLPDNIVDLSKRIANRINTRVEKNYNGTGRQGKIKIITSLKELNIDNQKSWLFISRNNFFLKEYKEHLEKNGMPYSYKGESSTKPNEVKAIKDYTHAQKNKTPIPSTVRVYLKPTYSIREPWYEAFKWDLNKTSYYRSIIGAGNLDVKTNNIAIETIHSIKGGEADNVVIMEDITRNVSLNMENNPDSENRIFYTGVTRTKENLYILQNSSRYHYDLRRLIW